MHHGVAWCSLDSDGILTYCEQRYFDLRLMVQDHESAGLVILYLLSAFPWMDWCLFVLSISISKTLLFGDIMLARDSTSGCFAGTSKSQGSLGAWGSFDARWLLASCEQRFLDMRVVVYCPDWVTACASLNTKILIKFLTPGIVFHWHIVEFIRFHDLVPLNVYLGSEVKDMVPACAGIVLVSFHGMNLCFKVPQLLSMCAFSSGWTALNSLFWESPRSFDRVLFLIHMFFISFFMYRRRHRRWLWRCPDWVAAFASLNTKILIKFLTPGIVFHCMTHRGIYPSFMT